MSKQWHPPSRVKQPVRTVLAKLGFEIVRLERPDTVFLQNLLRRHRIDVMLDVGANQGQYAKRMRMLGYAKTIHSFEPGREAFHLLAKHSGRDPEWTAHNCALSDQVGEQPLFVSSDSVSSSLLRVAEPHVRAAPRSAINTTEVTRVQTLDGMGLVSGGSRVWLKLDTQGSEDRVLAGANEALYQTFVVQTEISLVPCYEGQADYRVVLDILHQRGFKIVFVEKGTRDPSNGEMLQCDAIFERAG